MSSPWNCLKSYTYVKCIWWMCKKKFQVFSCRIARAGNICTKQCGCTNVSCSSNCLILYILYSRAVARRKEAEGMRHEWSMPKEEGAEAIRSRSLVVREWDDARGSLLSPTLALPPEQRPRLSFWLFPAFSLLLVFPTTCNDFCRCPHACPFVDAHYLSWMTAR